MSPAVKLARTDLERWRGWPAVAGPEPAPIAALRARAFAEIEANGWPTRRLESWRYTDPAPLIETAFAPPPAALADERDLTQFLSERCPQGPRLVLVNGRYSARHSRLAPALMPVAVWTARAPAIAAERLAYAKGAEFAFDQLGAALYGDGYALDVAQGVQLVEPIHIVHWQETEAPSAAHLRSAIRLGAGATATVVEHWAGKGPGWSNAGLFVELGEGASLQLYKLQESSGTGFHTSLRRVELATAARLEAFSLTLGGRISRDEIAVELAGTGADVALHGGYLLGGRQEGAMLTRIDHAKPECRTREVYKGCLAGRAHGVFQGRIRVAQHAQKTDAQQLNKTVILGERAVMDAKPELEIYADDVKCAHGASVGALDETAAFYLQARGIAPEAARRMLIEAFVLDAVELVPDDAVRALLAGRIAARLADFEEA